MGDAAAGNNSSERGSGPFGQDRRRTVDLVRVERGEPERRKLHRDPKPMPFGSDASASDDK
jgi:hypothetical protein